MSGFEVAGLLLGAIPMTFQSYYAVRELASKYYSFNRTLRGVLREIETAEGLFKFAVNQLLSEAIDEDRRKAMLENLESEHWHEDGLEAMFHSLLGDLFQPMMNSIQGVRESLEKIKTIMLKLSGKGLSPVSLLAMRVATAVTSLSIKTGPLRTQVNDIEIQSSRRKVTSIIKDTQGTLKALRDDLKAHNQSVVMILQLRHFDLARKPQQPTYSVGNSSREIPRGFPNAKTAQLASRKLYKAVSEALPCECHLLHLRLNNKDEETHVIGPSKGKSKESPTASEMKFCFQMTAKPNDNKRSGQSHSGITHSSLRLVFTARDPNTTGPSKDEDSKSKICDGPPTADKEYTRYFHGDSGSNISFLLRRISVPGMLSKNSDPTAAISLNDLVALRSDELSHYDQLLMAANLAYSILPFYSSPWIKDLSLQNVQFFEEQEQPTTSPGLWTPHLSVVFDDRDQTKFGIRNIEIRSLGIVLLGLGRKKRLEYSHEEEHVVIGKALYELCSKMGADYQRFVKKCLYEWGSQNEDLMSENNLDSFLSEINVLQSRSQGFNPTISEC